MKDSRFTTVEGKEGGKDAKQFFGGFFFLINFAVDFKVFANEEGRK